MMKRRVPVGARAQSREPPKGADCYTVSVVAKLFTSEQETEIAKDLTSLGIDATCTKWGVSFQQAYRCAARGGWKSSTPSQWHRTKALREDAFARPLSKEAAYWAGVLMADGSVTKDVGKRSPMISLDLAAEDRDHVEAFRRFLGAGHEVRRHHDGASYRLQVRSARLAADLSVLGVVPGKTDREKAGEDVVGSVDFWRGVLDGDGCYHDHPDGTPQVSLVGSRNLLSQWHHFIGIRKAITPHRGTFQTHYYGKNAIASIHRLHDGLDDPCLARKRIVAMKLLLRYE